MYKLGYTVELASPTGGHPPYCWSDVPMHGGATFVFSELAHAVAAARDYQRRNPEHDGWVRVTDGLLRCFPEVGKPLRVSVGGRVVEV